MISKQKLQNYIDDPQYDLFVCHAGKEYKVSHIEDDGKWMEIRSDDHIIYVQANSISYRISPSVKGKVDKEVLHG